DSLLLLVSHTLFRSGLPLYRLGGCSQLRPSASLTFCGFDWRNVNHWGLRVRLGFPPDPNRIWNLLGRIKFVIVALDYKHISSVQRIKEDRTNFAMSIDRVRIGWAGFDLLFQAKIRPRVTRSQHFFSTWI